MDKNAIKKFAVWARRELIERVSQKAMQYGIEKDNIVDAAADSINGKVLTDTQKNQRRALISQINAKGYEEVMEEVAYTWFNRLIALRFMEVNGYLPTRVRVFTDEENNFKPQIIDEALHLDLDGLNMEKVYEFKNANQTEELYKYLLITQCNALNSVLPGMFQRISDYTELLLPDNLLREGSVIEQMISTIPEEDWQDAVQIIGWLYQYYNAEKKDEVFAALKKNVKITKENIPAATQLFTPDWIVRYMVENSLGRLWVEGHPNDELKSGWKYYLEEAKQEPEVQAQLAEICKEYAAMTPEQIKCIDPCCGSGHILAYLFDVLVQIYESYGYTTREAVESIVKNNLYGLDIDDRAAQLAYFAVMMKARQYDRRFFSRQIQPNVYAIQESNGVSRQVMEYFENGDLKLTHAINTIVDELHDAKEYGSILTVTPQDWSALYARFDEIAEDVAYFKEAALRELLPLVQVAEALAQKYDVVVTNPPYMGASGMGAKLSSYVKKNYPDSKSDLFAVFMETCGQMVKKNGYQAMITQHVWMFLPRFEKLRKHIHQMCMINMAHLGARAFDEIAGEVVQTVSFVMMNDFNSDYRCTYSRLVDATSQRDKENLFLEKKTFFIRKQNQFDKLPGSPIAYWVSFHFLKCFEENKSMFSYAVPRTGMMTGDNNRFLRLWWEINCCNCSFTETCAETALQSGKKWFPYNKGGEFRRWYGNNDYVLNWENGGFEVFAQSKRDKRNSQDYPNEYKFKTAITWPQVSTGVPSFRLKTNNLFDIVGAELFVNDSQDICYFLGMLNSRVVSCFLQVLNPTVHYQGGNIGTLPVIIKSKEIVENFVCTCLNNSKQDWDSFETSWDFTKHPLIRSVSTVADAFSQWEAECDDRFNQLKANEEELNRIFIDIYGLQDELTPEVEDKDVTVRKAGLGRDIRSFISYAVGCMFGRYSLDVDGLAYAGGEWDAGKYKTYPADKDNIIPICDDEYFDDDMVGRFVKFVEIVYGKETLDENLKFIADALGGKGQPREVIRNYFLNDFYADHCKIYQKRPIYWLFDSGKKNGFKVLIYMHRYQPDTIARIRTDYVHEQQSRYRTAIADLENRIANASTSERVKLNKALTKLKDQDAELRSYEEKIHHLADQMIAIDLDDGVKVNYAKFQDVLGKIK